MAATRNLMAEESPRRLFLSYSHKDGQLRERVVEMLTNLKWIGLIELWYDREILPGKDWAKEIDDHLDAADLILCLVSPGVLASAYCNGIELKRALERHERGEARVIPVLLKPVDWEGEHHHSLSRLQPLAAPGRSCSGQRPAPIGQPIH